MVSGASLPAVVYRLGHLGDVALLTGVLAHWRETRGLSFVVATRAANAPLLAGHPAVADVVALDDAALKGSAWLREARRLAALYRGSPLIDLHSTLRSRVLSLVWRGKVRRYPKFALTRRLYARTRADRFRTALEALNVPQRYALALDETPPAPGDVVPRLFLSPDEQAAAKTRLAPLTGERPLVALHPYATHPAKQWPRSYWLGLTALLASEGTDWIVVGRDAEPLLPGHEHDLTNATDLRETCAVIQRADLLVTSDSGPMHLGTGAGTPVVGLFGPTARSWGFFPSGPRDRVLELDMACRPCSLHGGRPCGTGHRCMTGMTPETVMAAVRGALSPDRA
ncbi:glycosyltransferase family 9 protein [Pseudodesulfovibrio sp.]|uniref:glycosyltransferase family 9 protein n=1 Tax=Pseudodesulfovibrio sp. TaxID=2035812 RepID=UPI0026258334|nr:glycosyltransferase family 9 protein [Pseudodesulfovibrio sp.]MDD3311979.1 glycosyltransferase family 9 protein [Pseudodesulfovibrio sp.]